MQIGLYPIAAKPYHIGHHMMVQKGSQECDKFIIIVSLLDRENVSGADMACVWRDHIIPILPNNVSTIFLESSPVSRVFQILQLKEVDFSSDFSFRIYADSNDVSKYSLDKLQKVCPSIVMTNQVEVVGVPRETTTDISGTEMREFLASRDYASFKDFIPEEMDSKQVFDLLSANV